MCFRRPVCRFLLSLWGSATQILKVSLINKAYFIVKHVKMIKYTILSFTKHTIAKANSRGKGNANISQTVKKKLGEGDIVPVSHRKARNFASKFCTCLSRAYLFALVFTFTI